MKKIILINWETLEIKEKGVLHTECPDSVYSKLNEGIKEQNLVWLIEPDKNLTDGR